MRVAAFAAVTAAVVAWLVIAGLQIADGGFYSDDWAIQWEWDTYGYSEAVSRQFDILGSKPLLAIILPSSYEVLGTDPVWHHLLAASLGLATAAMFYLVLRGLRFESRDAIPITLLALLFPWASAVRLWPTGSVNNFAILLLFAGMLIALRALRVEGPRGLIVHVAATACFAASVLTYEVTTGVALFFWLSYVWLAGWRPALPRALMDVSAVSAAAIYSKENTYKYVGSFTEQVEHIPDILRDGADLIAASLLPVEQPAVIAPALTAAILGGALAILALAALRGRLRDGDPASRSGLRWATVATVALGALGLCWAIYVPQAFYTPTFRGLEDRVNIVALYPAAILVWAVLRAAGSLVPKNGYVLAVAGSVAILGGYWANDLRQQRDWAESTDLQEEVLSEIERANAPDSSVVLAFGYPADVAPRVPVLNVTYDLYPAAQLRTGTAIQTYPVFAGARVRCSPKGVALDRLVTPLYDKITLRDWGTPKLNAYSQVVFVDVGRRRHALITSPEQCAKALKEFGPGPWLRGRPGNERFPIR
jgi:hypothetical protein